ENDPCTSLSPSHCCVPWNRFGITGWSASRGLFIEPMNGCEQASPREPMPEDVPLSTHLFLRRLAVQSRCLQGRRRAGEKRREPLPGFPLCLLRRPLRMPGGCIRDWLLILDRRTPSSQAQQELEHGLLASVKEPVLARELIV